MEWWPDLKSAAMTERIMMAKTDMTMLGMLEMLGVGEERRFSP